MTSHPDVLYALATARQREAVSWAERRRLLTLLRRTRRGDRSLPPEARVAARLARRAVERREARAQAE